MSAKKESRLDNMLHSKSRQGDVEGIRAVLATSRVHIDSKDQEGTTPLMLASSAGHAAAVKLLLQEGADPNIRRISGVTAGFLASQAGYLDIVELIIEAGGDLDCQSQEGGTPLMAAAQAGHCDLVKKLLEIGANPNTAMWDGATPIFLAAQNGHAKVVMELLAAPGLDIDHQRRDGASSLWMAAQMGHDDIVRILLKGGAKVDLARADGSTPLYKACHKGHGDVVRELLAFSPNLGQLKNGETVLHAAALSGCGEVVRLLLSAGADPDLAGLSGSIPLDVGTGEAREILQSVTTTTNSANLGLVYRSMTPEKLSTLRSGNYSLIRSRFEHRSQSPLASLQTSPVRQSLRRSPSTCPPTPSPRGSTTPRGSMTPSTTPRGSQTPSTTPKHSVHFTDPPLLKDGVIVKKVQCRILEARELLTRETSPVRLLNLATGQLSPARIQNQFLAGHAEFGKQNGDESPRSGATGNAALRAVATTSRTH